MGHKESRNFLAVVSSLLLLFSFQNCDQNYKITSVKAEKSIAPSDSPGITDTNLPPSNNNLVVVGGNVVSSTTGLALGNVSIQLFLGTSLIKSVVTLTDGFYSFANLSPGNYSIKFVANGYYDYSSSFTLSAGDAKKINAALSPNLSAGQIRIVLTWTAEKNGAVKDVDSYLSLPGSSMPIYYDNKSSGNAELDIDDRDWQGPETITINSLNSGTYYYYVANFSDPCLASALGNSDIKVQVYGSAGLIKEYQLSGGAGKSFTFFSIKSGIITDIKQYDETQVFYISKDAANLCGL